MDSEINKLTDAYAILGLIAHAADSIDTGTADDPIRLAGFIRQTAFALAGTIAATIDQLEAAQ